MSRTGSAQHATNPIAALARGLNRS